MSAPFAPVADRLGKLIPRLASDHDGEVTATVAAIGRTLVGAGLDWHDLARRVAAPSFDDIVAVSTPTPSWSRPTSAAAEPAPPPPQPKAKREPPEWPTFGRLRHSERLAWLDAVENSAYSMERNTRAGFDALRAKLYHRSHEVVTSAEVSLFNRMVRSAWKTGARL